MEGNGTENEAGMILFDDTRNTSSLDTQGKERTRGETAEGEEIEIRTFSSHVLLSRQ